jgi:O-antigen/teichoic acid export membrane protein
MNSVPNVQPIGATVEAAGATASGAATAQIRGSSLLLAGRVIALLLNFAAQVLMVRYLSKEEYGIFAYALSIVTITQGLVAFGLPDTVSRYVPIHRERGEYGRMFGVILVVIATIVALSAAVIGLCLLRPDLLALIGADERATALILILIFLVPGDALNLVLNSLFASFARPAAIFWRKSVLIPGLRLLAVGLVIAFGGGLVSFGFGLPIASLLGLLLYAFYFVRLLWREGYLAQLRRDRLELPVGEVLGFALPLISATVVWHAIDSSNVLLLGALGTPADVAAYQAVVPLARINQVVGATFATLYIPMAARLFARDDRAGTTQLYWQTALWMLLLCFPIFALTFAFARPLTTLIYGERYLDSAPVLALLALGYFFQTAIGFNNLTLRVHKHLGFLMLTDLGAVTTQIGLSLLLLPHFGAVGAALATLITLVGHALLMQAGLRRYNIANGPGRGALPIYGATALLALLLAGAGWLLPVSLLRGWPLLLAVALGGLAATLGGLALLRIGRDTIQIEQLFPELTRLPLLRALLRWSGAARPTEQR